MASRRAMQDELKQLCRERKGVLRATDVVEYARDPGTALHESFTWDDTVAAEQYRLWQARTIIRVSIHVLPNYAKPVRMFVSLRRDQKVAGGGYRPLVSVLKNADTRAELLAEALAELDVYEQTYRTLTELAPLFAAAQQVRRQRKKASA